LIPVKPLYTIIEALLILGPAATAQPLASGGTVTGTILCDDTHGPARKASVYLESTTSNRPGVFLPPGEVFAATTNLEGAFAISDVSPGEYYVVTIYAGYISAREYIYPGAMAPEINGRRESPPSFVQRVTVVSGGAVNVQIRLRRGASISGSVAYSDGTPVPFVALTPKVKLSGGNFADTMSTGASHTDSTGHYMIDGLPDGSYVVLGGIEGSMVPVFGGDRLGGSGTIMFAGGTMRPSKARVIDVEAPREYTGVDIALPLVEAHEVSGSITGPDGHRLNHGQVRLYPTGEPRFSLATPLQGNGTFVFHRIPPDSYTVSIDNASDLVLTPKNNQGLRYDERTVVQKYRPVSKNIDVGDRDLNDVVLSVAPIR
jgi:Carboxypeptidase regulatory-like domain